MCFHEFEVAMFKNEIEDCKNYMVRWAVFGTEMLVIFHEMNEG